jgi:hypothetical protein
VTLQQDWKLRQIFRRILVKDIESNTCWNGKFGGPRCKNQCFVQIHHRMEHRVKAHSNSGRQELPGHASRMPRHYPSRVEIEENVSFSSTCWSSAQNWIECLWSTQSMTEILSIDLGLPDIRRVDTQQSALSSSPSILYTMSFC